MSTPEESLLGRDVTYPDHYDPSLLFPIPRQAARDSLGLSGDALPFIGHDRWHGYELSWLDARGKPRVATATFTVPCTSSNLIESKSFKLFLNSLNNARFNSDAAVLDCLRTDLSARAGADIEVTFGLPPMAEYPEGDSLDDLDVEIDHYGPPRADGLLVDPSERVQEVLRSALLKSNCPVTGQPDWATVIIRYAGPRIDRNELLRYLISFRNHAEFHEHCVERIYSDLMAHCQPEWVSVEARYTRRGGLDINPWRASPGVAAPVALRENRQ
ncbi:NADPH-dependent 7-cyano-7-deazaguanine reductase QueF [Pseudoxanthomonas indica]|uniref:NADPH-dependent 7-cyano-7-deazaguanine reductase n=1 Tax=Pseudoxanthomonas indica TaxID=428993 RepID=A0A1T5KM06_9GAMM|nr:NADPH-dependent 7-cyano-7-deazaguanine reductase QueF [Pseudoxanthomonas indica]GGD50043.1 NADPH-dependent 7-cyano-7-deazaguanine reductase [Pseudoxanthomonas indica]SKC64515.1 7-cyano-7-deazaguanine reductase [Pseudoxanthomonas indica]